MSACEGVLNSVSLQEGLDDGEEQEYGRIIPLGEFIERLKTRADIFTMDKESRLSKTEAVCIALALAAGVLFATIHVVRVPPDFICNISSKDPGTVTISADVVEVTPTRYFTSMPKPSTVKLSLKPSVKPHGSGRPAGGVGSPSARAARMNAFRMLANRIAAVATTGIEQGGAQNGIFTGLDIILDGKRSIQRGGGTGSGRRLEPGIGVGIGFGPSGLQPGNGSGLGDPLDGLMQPNGEPVTLRQVRHSSSLETIGTNVKQIGCGVLSNGRSKSGIMRTVMENLPAVRYAYNRWLRQHPGAAGKITLKFAIDEFGNVIFCDVQSATLQGSELSSQVISIVKTWNFGKIDKPGDITEAVYPLVFSM
jgi:hypothetical protein